MLSKQSEISYFIRSWCQNKSWESFQFSESENMTFAVIGHLTQKLTYDGILQLTKTVSRKIVHLLYQVNKLTVSIN